MKLILNSRPKWMVLLILLSSVAGLSLILKGSFIHLKAELSQYLLNRAWQKTLDDAQNVSLVDNTFQGGGKDVENGSNQIKPWPWADTWPVAKIASETLQIEQIILAGNSGQALAFGPGVAANSVALGDIGSVVISGHRDAHFQWLQYLKLQDKLTLQDRSGSKQHFEIANISVQDIRNSKIYQTNYKRLLLVTCYPFNSMNRDTPWRYVVEALPIIY